MSEHQSGWQQRIAAMWPWARNSDDDWRCVFCSVTRCDVNATVRSLQEARHRADCLWQNAKDALPPSSSESLDVRKQLITRWGADASLQGVPYRRMAADVAEVLGWKPSPSWADDAGYPEELAPAVDFGDRCAEADAVRAVRSISTMLGWACVPSQNALEADIRSLKARARDVTLPPVSETSPAKQLARDVLGLVDTPKRREWTKRPYRCRSCGHEMEVLATEHKRMMCGRTNCVGETEPVAEADASPAKDPIADAVDAQLDPLKDELIDIGHKLAKEEPACCIAVHDDGWYCTLSRGHAGEHIATNEYEFGEDVKGRVFARWSNEARA